MPQRYIGLMSGTSLDGVDGVLAHDGADGGADAGAGDGGPSFSVTAHAHRPFPPALREELLALNRRGGSDELHRAALAANALAAIYAEVVGDLLRATGVAAGEVRAIGAHGQTVRHQPRLHDGTGYTLQLLNGALLAERCAIDVVCDLRSRDVAAGGQGAPLVPAFHAALFGRHGEAQAVLNLGGIANLTLLDGEGGVLGFDCGPANLLLDLWAERHLGQPFDRDGRWAAAGHIDAPLLATLMAEPFLALPPPKSTGRELFDAAWLDAALARRGGTPAAVDVMATLAEFSATAAVQGLRFAARPPQALHVCGGGALNPHLMSRLQALAPGLAVASTEAIGLPPQQVEAAAFAWLARAFVDGEAGNLPAVTGAAGPRRLGALHPAR